MLLSQRSNPEPIATSTLAAPPLPLRERQKKSKKETEIACQGRRASETVNTFILTSIHYIDLACDHLVKKLFLGDDRSVC